MLKEGWSPYQKAVKAAKTKYFSEIIAANLHDARVLYNTLNSVLNVNELVPLEASNKTCNSFLNFFMDKVGNIRSLISLPSHDPSMLVSCSDLLDQFHHVSLSSLEKFVCCTKTSGSPCDIVPLLKEVFPMLGT